MKKTVFTILGLFVIGILSFLSFITFNVGPVIAQAECPSYMKPSSVECLDYLREQLALIQKQQGNIQNQLKGVEYQKLSLEEKIKYTNNLIQETENAVKELQIEIAAADIEISMFEMEIKTKADDIAILKQEIGVLSTTVNERISETYKYSFINQLELLLDFKNIGSILRKIKYLEMTRAQDKEVLGEHTEKTTNLVLEENKLSAIMADLEAKREEVERERVELGEKKLSLDAQKREREALLAQAKIKEAELLATYQQNLRKSQELDQAIIAYIGKYGAQAANKGYVSAGTWIGRMGNTGWSSGAHLHFSMRGSHDGNPCYGTISVLNGYLTQGGPSWITGWDGWRWPYVYAGSWRLPIAGPSVIMSQNYHEGKAIDLISYKADRSVNFGAPIYAVMEGTLFKATDGNGGEYAYIRHPNGWTSCYLHLQK